MRTSKFLSIPILLGGLAVCAPCAAEPAAPLAKPVAEAMTEKARQLFTDGLKAYQRSRWAEARAAFLAAWALSNHYSISGNLADCELKLGLYRDAAEHLARYLREMAKDTTSTPKERQDGAAGYAKARARVGQADVQANLPGAELYVDGKLVGAAPLEDPVFLDPGRHVIEARGDGYPAVRVEIEAKAGVAQAVALTLVRALAPDRRAEPAPSTSSKPGLGWIVATGVLGAGGLGAGIGLTMAANQKGTDADGLRGKAKSASSCAGASTPTCTALNSALTRKSTLSDGAFAGFLGGGVLALTATGLGVWTALAPKTKDEQKAVVRVVPIAGPQDAGLFVRGTW